MGVTVVEGIADPERTVNIRGIANGEFFVRQCAPSTLFFKARDDFDAGNAICMSHPGDRARSNTHTFHDGTNDLIPVDVEIRWKRRVPQ